MCHGYFTGTGTNEQVLTKAASSPQGRLNQLSKQQIREAKSSSCFLDKLIRRGATTCQLNNSQTPIPKLVKFERGSCEGLCELSDNSQKAEFSAISIQTCCHLQNLTGRIVIFDQRKRLAISRTVGATRDSFDNTQVGKGLQQAVSGY